MSNTLLKNQAVGSTVWLKRNGTPTSFVVVHQGNPDPALYDSSCDGSWLMAQQALTTRSFHTTAAIGSSNYGASALHTWLQNEFFAQLDQTAKTLVRRVRIPWCEGPDQCIDGIIHTGSSGLETTAFLPSLLELGIDEGMSAPADGAKLAYFEAGKDASACKKRAALLGSTPVSYWTRSLFSMSDSEMYTISSDGSSAAQNCSWDKGGVRPLLILSGSAMVQSDGTLVLDQPPAAPASITLPEKLSGGSPAQIQWAAAPDPEGDLKEYQLERSTNGGSSFQQVYHGTALQYTDTLPSGCTQVQYRVRAVDQSGAASPYTVSPQRTVHSNSAPVIASQTPNGTDLGEKTAAFTLQYTVTDPDDDPVTVEERLDETRLRQFQAVLGAANTLTVTDGQLAALVKGSTHSLTLTATDGRAAAPPYRFTFRKGEPPYVPTEASIQLAAPVDTGKRTQLLCLKVEGNIPADAQFTVEAANNARDPAPAWETLTEQARSGQIYRFQNHTAQSPWALDLRIRAIRGAPEHSGWISGFHGTYLVED